MPTIRVKMKDGDTRVFEDRGAPGGSYCQSIKYEPGFVVIESAYGDKKAIPSDLIAEIDIDSYRRRESETASKPSVNDEVEKNAKE